MPVERSRAAIAGCRLCKRVAQELFTRHSLQYASHLKLTAAASKEAARPVSGLCCPKKSKAVPERVIRGQSPTSTHFWVRVCTLEGQAHATESTAGSCDR